MDASLWERFDTARVEASLELDVGELNIERPLLGCEIAET